MPRIVSGADEFNPDAALLRGTAIGREWGQARNERDAEQRKHLEALFEFHKEMAKVKKAEHDALEKHNQGQRDSKALATHAALLEREKMNPRFRALVERKGLVEKSLKGMAARGVSEDTIQRVIQHVKGTEESLRKQDQDQQFDEYLKGLEGHAAVPPEAIEGARQQKMMGGNPAQIVKGIEQQKNKAAADEAFVRQNSIGAQRAAQFVEGMPPGTLQHAQATALLAAWEHDPARQKKSGEGEKLFQDILKLAGGGSDEEYQKFKKARAEAAGEQPAFGLGGMTQGEMQHEVSKTPHGGWYENVPQVPPLDAQYGQYAAGLQAEKERRYPGQMPGGPNAGAGYSWDFQDGASAGGSSDMPQPPMPTGADIVAQAQAAGVDVTDPAVLQQILASIEAGGAPPGR